MNTFKCDKCEKETFLYPPTELVWEEIKIEVPVPYTEEIEVEGKVEKVVKFKTEYQTQKTPKLITTKRLNPFTHKYEEFQTQEVKDLKPRAYLVRLSIGDEVIQKDFCVDCLSEVKQELKQVWDKLISYQDKE